MTASEHPHVRAWALSALRGEDLDAFPGGGAGDGGGTAQGLLRLCHALVGALDGSGATVVLRSRSGAEVVAAATHDAARRVTELEFDIGEGPAHEAQALGRPVLVTDLLRAASRWPAYVDSAMLTGIGAQFSFPLRLGAARFGVLTVLDDHARDLDVVQTARALAVTDVATDLLLHSADLNPLGEMDTSLVDSLQFRSEVYQAQGALMVDLGVSLSEALLRMRAHAFATGQDLTAVAIAIVEGHLRLADDPPT